jgi:hypothetical protein
MSHHLYKQEGSNNWRVRFRLDGIKVNESTGTTVLSEAKAYLDKRRQEVRDGSYAPRSNQLTITVLAEAKLAADKINNLDSYETVKGRWTLHLKPFFGGIKAAHLSTEIVRKYISKRLEEKAANASINRELAFLRSAFSLARKSGRMKASPWFPMLPEDNVRTGFLKDDQYQKLATACSLEGSWLRGIFEVANAFGWRSESVRTLKVRQVDFAANTVRLDDSKGGFPVLAVMTTAVRQILEICCAGKQPDNPVFTYKDGSPVLDFRKPWGRATIAAGVPGLLVHDLARTAMRNMRRLGISESVSMKIAGRRTASIFRRYDIVDQADLADAARRLDEKAKEVVKVVVIPAAGEKPQDEGQVAQVPLVH